MTHGSLENIIPVFLSLIAAFAMTSAGFLLFQSRDHLETPTTDVAPPTFLAYDAPSPSKPSQEPRPEPWQQVDWEQLTDEEGWEVLDPADDLDHADLDHADLDHTIDIGQSRTNRRQQGDATLVVITNFTRANVTVNGNPYPTYSDDGENRGLRLPSAREHEIRVQFGENHKIYRVRLNRGERRLLMVELTGMNPSGPTPKTPREPRRADTAEPTEEPGDGEGQITVYSRPRGAILVGERDMGQQTPGTIEIEEGRHEVQVRYESGEISETKVVRVREGSRIKLFFRETD